MLPDLGSPRAARRRDDLSAQKGKLPDMRAEQATQTAKTDVVAVARANDLWRVYGTNAETASNVAAHLRLHGRWYRSRLRVTVC